MKVKISLRKLCDACQFVRRRGKLFVVCKANKKVALQGTKKTRKISCVT